MKTLLTIIFLSALSWSALGQTLSSSTPVRDDVQGALKASSDSQYEMLKREARNVNTVKGNQVGGVVSWYLNSADGTGTRDTVVAGDQTSAKSAQGPVPMGRLWIVRSFSIGAEPTLYGVQVSYNFGPNGIVSEGTFAGHGFISPMGGTWAMPTPSVKVPEYGALSLYYYPRSTLGNVTTTATDFIDVTNDQFYEAQHIILVCGDSIGHTAPGTNGITSNTSTLMKGTESWPFLITGELRENKHASVRLVNKSFGSSHSQQWADRIPEGYLNLGGNVGLIVIEQGVNDASIPTSEGNFTNNLAKFLLKRNATWPTASLIFCGPPSIRDDSGRPTVKDFTTYTSNMVSNFGGATSNVYFCDLSLAYTTNSTANYGDYTVSSDTLIHPNKAGQRLIANVLKTNIATTKFYKATLGLTGTTY
jgi:hypothetical protein